MGREAHINSLSGKEDLVCGLAGIHQHLRPRVGSRSSNSMWGPTRAATAREVKHEGVHKTDDAVGDVVDSAMQRVRIRAGTKGTGGVRAACVLLQAVLL